MASCKGFYWKKEVDKDSNLEFIILGYRDKEQLRNCKEAWIVPSSGSNLCRFSVGEKNIIDFDVELLLKGGYTGTPVLYPTPNRVRNGMFIYKGRIFNQVKRGEPVFEHGLVHNEAWEYNEPVVKDCCVCFNTWIDFDKASTLFEAFPFNHRLMLEFCLSADGIRVTYTIHNMDDQDIPFGFGLHPYFMKLSGEGNTYISLPADCVMDYTSDLLPTGRLIDVKGTVYDIRNKVAIGKLDMDHVFTCISEGRFAEIVYDTLAITVTLNATGDFSHLVLYSPRGKDFFCIENQTCSTDAHNMFDRGFAAESGLKFVPAGGVHSGCVKYMIKFV